MPSLIEGKGSVVLASSVNGVLGIGEAAYSCAKAALHPLAMNIATAYGKHGRCDIEHMLLSARCVCDSHII